MPVLKMPAPLRSYVNGLAEVPVHGATVGAAIGNLLEQFPVMRPHLTDPAGKLRPFVNLFLGSNNIKDLQGLDTPLDSEDVLTLVPSIAGGAGG
jgi:molybdopterin converting factor small subunit